MLKRSVHLYERFSHCIHRPLDGKSGAKQMKYSCLKALSSLLLLTGLPAALWAQSCQTRDEAPEQIKTAVETGAQKVFEQAAKGDVNGMKANAMPSLQSGFDGIATAISDNKAGIEGARSQLRASFLLDTGATPAPDGRFYCGVFGANGMTGGSAEFDLPGLPAGKYAIVIQDLTGGKAPFALTTIFQDSGGWKLAGFYIRPESAIGHDGLWYLERARDFKGKGQAHSAWINYVTSWDLMAPVTFIETRLLSKITQESNSIHPKDIPGGGNAVDYSANGKTYKILSMSVIHNEKTMDLSIKYSVPSTADFNATQADARNLANAYVAQYPELKEVVNNVWTHAVDSSGGDVAGLVNLKPAAKE